MPRTIPCETKQMTEKEVLLNEIDAFVGLRFSLMLIPIHKFLYKISKKQLWEAIYNLTSEVRLNIETILAKYKISAAESKPNEKKSINIGNCVKDLTLSVSEPRLIKIMGQGRNDQEIVKYLKITDKGRLLLI